ncbi:MAG: 50S ribosomal protein L19 [candidate division WOR-3 bacterium]|nr:50S ribosomal protein L19 [candidate division WOR-3 bacterium]
MNKLNTDKLQREFEKNHSSENDLSYNIGDTVNVSYKIKEGDKVRVQKFRGIVIARRGSNATKTFTVRKISQGIGVERIFPVNSPSIDKIEVLKKGNPKRAKIHYMRDRTGRAATKVKE